MKIVLISNEYPLVAAHGGLGVITRAVAKALTGYGHAVTVVGIGEGAGELDDDGIRVVTLPRSSTRGIAWFVNRLRVWRWLQRAARAGQIDVIEVPDFEGMLPFRVRGCTTVVRLNLSSTTIARQANGRSPNDGPGHGTQDALAKPQLDFRVTIHLARDHRGIRRAAPSLPGHLRPALPRSGHHSAAGNARRLRVVFRHRQRPQGGLCAGRGGAIVLAGLPANAPGLPGKACYRGRSAGRRTDPPDCRTRVGSPRALPGLRRTRPRLGLHGTGAAFRLSQQAGGLRPGAHRGHGLRGAGRLHDGHGRSRSRPRRGHGFAGRPARQRRRGPKSRAPASRSGVRRYLETKRPTRRGGAVLAGAVRAAIRSTFINCAWSRRGHSHAGYEDPSAWERKGNAVDGCHRHSHVPPRASARRHVPAGAGPQSAGRRSARDRPDARARRGDRKLLAGRRGGGQDPLASPLAAEPSRGAEPGAGGKRVRDRDFH